MKKNRAKIPKRTFPLPWIRLKEKDRKAFMASIQKMDERCEGLGLIDPTDAEPAVIYFPEEPKR